MVNKRETNTIKKSLRQIDNLLLLLSIVTAIALLLIYYFAEKIFVLAELPTINLIKNLIVGFLSVIMPFDISYFILRKIQELKTEQAQADLIEKISLAILPEIKKLIIEPNQHYELIDFDKIKWDELLSGAKKIDIFVHYFDTWMRNNSELLKRVFLNDGVIRIILPNIKNRGIINLIKHRFPEYTEKQIREKIIGTKGKLNDYKDSIDKGILEIYETDELGYYCGIKIDEKYFIYSSYEHIRIDRKILGPTFVIRIDKEIEIGQWFSKEFTELSRKVINNKK